MPRSVPEWVGRTDDERPPPRVQLRVLLNYEGVCQCRDKCGMKILSGDHWDVDHAIALANGGLNRESNLAPVLRAHHPNKTKRDMAIKSKISREAKKNYGLSKSKWPPMAGTKRSGWRRKMNGEVVRRDD